jgi:type IV pilus assembly protein PilO
VNLNWLKNLPSLQRNLIGGALVAIVLGLVVYFGYLPRAREVDTLKADLAQINSEVTIYQAKVKKLDTLLAENERLQRELTEMRRQLPEGHEVADLLKQVSDAGAGAGLVFRLWRPGPATVNASGLYQELPVEVEVAGGYHQVGVFFEKVAHLDRIVNVGDVEMKPDNTGGLITRLTATAFAAVPADYVPPDAQNQGKPGAKPRKKRT